MAAYKWTISRIQNLRIKINNGEDLDEIAQYHGCTRKGIETQIGIMRDNGEFLYLKQLPTRFFKPHDDEFLIKAMNQCRMFQEVTLNAHIIPYMVKYTGRSVSNVINRIHSLQKNVTNHGSIIGYHTIYEDFQQANNENLKNQLNELILENKELKTDPNKFLKKMVTLINDELATSTGSGLPKNVMDIFDATTVCTTDTVN